MSLTETAPQPIRTAPTRGSGVGALSLAGMELRAGLRSASFRLLVLASVIIGWSAGGQPGRGVALSAWRTGEAAWKWYGFVAIAWMAFVAVQDLAARTDVLVFSKPQPTERLVLSRYLAAYGQIALALIVVYLAAMASRLYTGGGLAGFTAYVAQYFVSAGVLFFVGGASYAMALMLRTPLAGASVGLYWVLAMAGKEYLPKALYPSYSQNVPIYVFFSLFLLGVACWFYRYRRRGGQPLEAWVRPLALGSFVVTALLLWRNLTVEVDPMIRTDPNLESMAAQTPTIGELTPGFRLPDQSGRLASLADYPGRILVVALWSPDDPESTLVLDRLEDIRRQYGSRGVQPVAICISQDNSAAGLFARGADLGYPVALDWGTHNATKISDSSPLASAYEADTLPHLVVTDRRRRLRTVIKGVDAYEGNAVTRAIEERLNAEPE